MDVYEWVKEEPDCGACCDSGVIYVGTAGHPDPAEVTRSANCPDCRPTPEQAKEQAAQYEATRLEWERAVAAGEIDPDEAPF